jgi:hypothetical protein
MAESTDYVRCSLCGELKLQGSYSCTSCAMPAYDIDSAQLKKARKVASDGSLMKWPKQYRQAYGAAVEAAVLAKQRSMLKRHGEVMPAATCASGTWHTTGEAIHKAVQQQQRAALAAYPAKVRRDRLPRWNPETGRHEHKWLEMYKAAMPEGFVPSWETKESWEATSC